MNDLISRKELYDKAATLEVQALDYVGRLIERDGDEPSVEWKIWNAILIERTAFKHDVYDAPSAHRWIPVSERVPEVGETVLLACKEIGFNCCEYTSTKIGIYNTNCGNIVAWMPLPELYEDGKDEDEDND